MKQFRSLWRWWASHSRHAATTRTSPAEATDASCDYLHWFESTNGQDGIFESSKGYIKFNDDNTYISVSDIIYTDEWVEIYGAQKHEIEIERGSYKISGNTITLPTPTRPTRQPHSASKAINWP